MDEHRTHGPLVVPDHLVMQYFAELVRPYVEGTAHSVCHGKHPVGEFLATLENMAALGNGLFDPVWAMMHNGMGGMRAFVMSPAFKFKNDGLKTTWERCMADYPSFVLMAIKRQLPRMTHVLLDQPHARGVWIHGMYTTLAIHSHRNHNFMVTLEVLIHHAPAVPWQDFVVLCARRASTKNLEAFTKKYRARINAGTFWAFVRRCGRSPKLQEFVSDLFASVRGKMTPRERANIIALAERVCPSMAPKLRAA